MDDIFARSPSSLSFGGCCFLLCFPLRKITTNYMMELSIGDLIDKILAWVPVTSLLRFKSVCKSWRDLIDSSVFIDLHTTTSTTLNSSSKFGSFIFIASVYVNFPTKTALLMLSESVSESNDMAAAAAAEEANYNGQVFKVNDNLMVKLDNLGFSPIDSDTIRMIGSFNGLVCLHQRHHPDPNPDPDQSKQFPTDGQFYLWNPATRQFRLLPRPTISSEDNQGPLHTLAAFGFDVKTKDYKLMLLTYFRARRYPYGAIPWPMECFCRVQVYSLSTDSWSLLEGITSLPGYPSDNQVIHLNGSCFFLTYFFHTEEQLCSRQNNRFLISFDFTNESITPIQLPDHHQYDLLYLTYLGDKIALFKAIEYFDYDTGISTHEDFSIWVLNEHASSISSSSSVNKESWTKLHSFGIQHTRNVYGSNMTHPRGISNDGEFALLETKFSFGMDKKLKLYNFVTKEVKKDFLVCSQVNSIAIAYKPSLVSIVGPAAAAAAAAVEAAAAGKVIGGTM